MAKVAEMDKFMEAVEEVHRFESRLKEEDFENYTAEAIECEKNELEMLWVKYKMVYEVCCAEAAEKSKVYAKHNKTHRTYIRCVNIIAKAKTNRTTVEETQPLVRKQNFSISVPPCDTGVFRGDYTSWPTFRDMFTAIYIDNTRLSPVEKLFYLFQKTEGEAREINQNIALTAENFEIAWTNLKSQYENKRVLVNSQLRLLFNMAPCKQDSPQEVKRLQRDINNCMSVLKLFKIDIGSWDPIFVFLCSARLSEQTLNLWEQSVKNKTEPPKWDELNSFLTDRYHTLESVSDIMATNSRWSANSQVASHKSHQTTAKVNQSRTHHTKADVAQCKLCSESHHISSCPKFLSMDNKGRASTLRKFNYCFNCLGIGHMYVNCLKENACKKCQKKHHTLLHRDFTKKVENKKSTFVPQNQNQQSTSRGENIQSTDNPTSSRVVQTHHTCVAKNVMLATAWVRILHLGSIYEVRALIDPCSDESFISERIQKMLKLPTVPVLAEVTGLGGELVSSSRKMATFVIASRVSPIFEMEMNALVVSHVTGDIPTHSLESPTELKLPNLEYADPEFYRSDRIDILLGGNLYPSIIRDGLERGILNSLVAQNTVFGWIVTGPTNAAGPMRSIKICHVTKVTLDEQLSKFWELEEISQAPFLSEDDKKCEEIYCSTTVRRADGRYVVNLPFRTDAPTLGPNRHVALRQFLGNERSLLKRPEYKNQYDEVMREYLAMGHMRKIEVATDGPSYYLPHHGVFKPESTTTKLRVVYNASSPTSNGKSLNDILYVGPALQEDIVALMLRWRFSAFVFTADISKMYRQIMLAPEQTCFQRVIYRDSEFEDVSDYELQTVTFGVNCAPYLAIRTLHRLAEDEKSRFPVGAKIISSSMYVDDLLVGADTLPEALEAKRQLIGILKSGGFDLRKWAANTKENLQDLPEDHLLSSSFMCFNDTSVAKTLGLHWNAAKDYFFFVTENLPVKEAYTRREVLSIVARLYDPIGFLAPIVITAKIIMQDMWLDKAGWDDKIKPVALFKWKKFVAHYQEIDLIKIPRWVTYSPQCHMEYHAFCDSSEAAYAVALYARVQIEGKIYSNLLTSKTKVAPIRKPSLPRLELCGAVLLAKMVGSLIPKLIPTTSSLYLWSDSTIVLAWLRKPPCAWKTFVANRVALILEKVGNGDWAHVVSQDNPADLATRGMIASELKDNSLWWHGPKWLSQEKTLWPKTSQEFTTVEEFKGVQVFVARSSPEEDDDPLNRFSSLPRAIHVIAYMFRFVKRAKLGKRRSACKAEVRLTAEELSWVKTRLFLLSQQRHFSTEHLCLSQRKNLPSNSSLLTLTPFLDRHQLIRANGRLGSTKSLSYHERHPIILAYSSRLAQLYVDFVHKMVLHGGPRLVLNTIRLECWILKAKNLVKSRINNCKECVIYKKKYQGQIMADLPEDRTTFNRPFTITGVDFAGPFEIKSFTGRYCRITKGYVCLFVCFSTKAIHLEAVSDLSTPAFLAALTRFVSRRGCPSKIYSDNGKNFVGAARQIEANFVNHIKDLRDEAVSKFGHQKLSWHFIPPSAPHMGGLWEAGVKSFKMHLKKISGQIKYTLEEFSTLLASIEACLNSRPLSPLSNDSQDLSALTPGHFLIGSAILTPPEPKENSPSESIIYRWRKIQAMQQELCLRWKEEYLKELQKRSKWKVAQEDIQENDLVVIRNEPLCPTEWRLGRVTKIFRGSDNRVRVAELRTQNGTLKRPIHKMVLLPRDS